MPLVSVSSTSRVVIDKNGSAQQSAPANMIRVDRRATQGLVWSSLLLGAFAACSETIPTDEASDDAESTKHSSKAAGGVPSIVRVQLAATVTGGTGGTSSTPTTNIAGNSSSGGATFGTGGGTSVSIVPLVSTFCGDGIRDPNQEECDDGPSPNGNLCNWACQLTDGWVQHSDTPLKPGQRISRQLGLGSHSVSANANTFAVAMVEQLLPDEDAVVRLNTFDELGILTGSHIVSEGTWPADNSDPVVAVLANGDVLTAYTEFGGDGDGLGIALRRLRAGQTQPDDVRYISDPSFASQQHADILALPDGVVVVYTDESDASSGPQLRVREFDLSLNPRASRSLSGGTNVDGRASLTAIDDSWGTAWRALSNDNNNEDIKVYDASTNTRWTVGPYGSGPSGEQPALTQLGQYHRLVLFGVGTDPDSDGVSSTGRFHYAVLDTRSPGAPVREGILERHSAYAALLNQGELRPSLVSFGTEAYLAWQSGAATGDANGEESWFQRITASSSSNSLDVTLDEETALPRWSVERKGDQRNPTLAILGPSSHYPTGALVSVWEDYGKNLGTSSGEPDVVVQFSPLTLRRESTASQDCTTTTRCTPGKGRCTADAQCQSDLVCSTIVGPNFGMAPGIGICAAPNCVANGKPVCGVAGCGTCHCGDRVVESLLGEQCDDGGNSSSCDSDCTYPSCGDGIANTAANEACDPGSVGNDSPTCNRDCTLRVCGDGKLNSVGGETCDPGSVGTNTATCDRDCTAPVCGDNLVNSTANEACDPGTIGANVATCDKDCTAPVCGDNLVNSAAGEACDPGTVGANTAICDRDCTAPVCGDNVVNSAANEACDPGTVGANVATCDKDCTAPVCGDNLVNAAAGEECDLGTAGNNSVNCMPNCKLPASYTPTGAYVVEGDMTFPTKTELSQYYSGNSTQGAMATLLLGGTAKKWTATERISLSYCVSSSGFGSNYTTVLNAMSAAAAYWEQTANVHFEYLPAHDSTCTNSNSNVTFNVSADSTMTYNALSFFPSYPRANRQLVINYARSTALSPRTLSGVLVHQLGHVLGFIHDHINCDSTLVPLPGTSASCGTSTMDYAVSVRDKWLTSTLYGSATYRRGVYETRTDNATPVDWDAGYNKATATAGFAIVGLSQNGTPEWRGSAILSYPGLPGEFTGNQAAVMINNYAAIQRTERVGDWDYGYNTFECGANEYVSGVSQATTSPYHTHAVRCSTTNVVNGFNEVCEVRGVSTADSRGMTTSGDWDWGRIKGECSAGKVIVGVSAYAPGSDTSRFGRPHAILCCGSSSRNSVAYNYEQRDAGFTDGNSWDGTYNKARCAPSYGITGLSQVPDNSASAAILCSPSSNGQFSEGASVIITNTSGDQRRYSRSGDWDPGWIKLECGANEYISGLSQSSTSPTALHAIRCTAGNLANQGLNNCETRAIATADNRGTTATGDWSVGRTKYECSPGKVLVGIGTSWALDSVPANRSKPHSIFCCSR